MLPLLGLMIVTTANSLQQHRDSATGLAPRRRLPIGCSPFLRAHNQGAVEPVCFVRARAVYLPPPNLTPALYPKPSHPACAPAHEQTALPIANYTPPTNAPLIPT